MASWPWNWPRVVIPSIAQSAEALRTTLSEGLMGKPVMLQTRVDYAKARGLYRNDLQDFLYGGGFVRPIINLAVEYIGLPYVTSDEGARDTFLNEGIHDHWAPAMQEFFIAILRDSKSVFRFRQPSIANPLFTEEDRMHGQLDIIPPEMVDITWDPTDPDMMERAVVMHFLNIDERTDTEALAGVLP